MERSDARCLYRDSSSRSAEDGACLGEALKTGVGPHGQSRRSHGGWGIDVVDVDVIRYQLDTSPWTDCTVWY